MQKEPKLNDEFSNKSQSDITHEKVVNFTDFLENLSISREVCNRDPEFCRLPYHISESELKNEVEEIYLLL